MIGNVTSLTNNGLRDWLLQRFSALILAVYVFFLFGYFFSHPNLQFAEWHTLFASNGVRILSFVTLISIVVHAWIGIWTVTTDYLKCVYARLTAQVLVALVLLSLLIWGVEILWSNV
ncbi:MAG: succinate dehydrogenase, hydrophobic membrane anchor protein [Proteobacteria bacterium]|nr:succinate dehydrogenase, hydrophobic membrane anchor protein [Pseudomonadota bacterium]